MQFRTVIASDSEAIQKKQVIYNQYQQNGLKPLIYNYILSSYV